MASGRYIAHRAQKEILLAILNGYNKGIDHLLDAIINRKRYSVNRSVNTLVENGLLELSGDKIELTERGLALVNHFQIEKITIGAQKWDGVWRIVAYDIPEELRHQRDNFRHRLRELGFTKIQGSMWLIPWECKEEIAILARYFNISPFVMYLLTDYVPNQTRLRQKYGLK
jgi:DNA-binding transcriptional regulator PaaX